MNVARDFRPTILLRYLRALTTMAGGQEHTRISRRPLPLTSSPARRDCRSISLARSWGHGGRTLAHSQRFHDLPDRAREPRTSYPGNTIGGPI